MYIFYYIMCERWFYLKHAFNNFRKIISLEKKFTVTCISSFIHEKKISLFKF